MIIIITIVATFALLIYNKVIILNNPSSNDYPIRGVDVSKYQGEINWDILSKQNISFAFIKSTEGSSYVDPKFKYNWNEASKMSLVVGAYHFFSFDSSAKTQAENFISHVPKQEGTLPPVVDIEFYGNYKKDHPSKAKTQAELQIMLNILKSHYGKEPIIYATQSSYNLYIKDNFPNNDIWIRNVYFKPSLYNKREWSFWQYSDTTVLDGYNGEEKYIDMNVFNSTTEEFEQLYN